jgi:hypothetical protein
MERGWLPAAFCSNGADWGVHVKTELIYVGGSLASAIFRRHGGELSTSDAKALL